MPFVERRTAVTGLARALAESAGGVGRFAAVTGALACGKTTLLADFADRALESGALVLTAVASRGDRDLPLGAVRQLAAGLPDQAPSRFVESVLAEAAARPVVATVDDVQHVDAESLRVLTALRGRCAAAPVLVVLAEREPVSGTDLVRTAEHRVRLTPLDHAGVAGFLTAATGTAPERAVTTAHLRVSGGNPVLLHALLADAPAEPGRGPAFRQAVLSCLHRWGDGVPDLAKAAAVLGAQALPGLVADLAGTTRAAAATTTGALTSAGLMSGGRIAHDAVREAVLGGLTAAERVDLHHRAAALLHEHGAAPTDVARHLVAAGRVGHPWAAEVLHAAAAADDGRFAVRCLELALPVATDPQAATDALAAAEWRYNPFARPETDFTAPAARPPARPAAADPADAVDTVVPHDHLSRAASGDADFGPVPLPAATLPARGPLPGATAAVPRPRTGFADPVVAARHGLWHADRQTVATLLAAARRADPRAGAALTMADDWLHGPRRPRPLPEPVKAADRWQRSAAALLPGLLSGALPEVVRDAERVLRGCPLNDHTLEILAGALVALVHADRADLAATWCDGLIAGAREKDATTWSAVFGAARAEISLRQGAPRAAGALAEESLRLLPDRAWGVLVGLPLSTMLSAETALGVTTSAALRHVLPESAFDTVFGVKYLHARGNHYLATDRVLAAVADFEECGRRMTSWGLDLPSLAPWRTGLAAAHLRAGRHRAAALLADEQLALPAATSRYTRALALRVLARSRGTGLLRQAAEEFRAAGDRYGAAVTLAELSRALAERGDAAEARRVARSATEVAKPCGVADLVERVLRHRPSAHPTHTDAAVADLSEAEQRVAALAALGHTNKEVADLLHVTVSTVEQHLTRVYRKLGVRRRGDLPARLAAERPA